MDCIAITRPWQNENGRINVNEKTRLAGNDRGKARSQQSKRNCHPRGSRIMVSGMREVKRNVVTWTEDKQAAAGPKQLPHCLKRSARIGNVFENECAEN